MRPPRGGPRASMVRRLAIGFGGSFILLTLLSGASLYGLLNRQLESERNLVLQDRLDAIDSLLKSPAHGLEELHRRLETEWPLRGGEKVAARVVDGRGELIAETPQIPPVLKERLEKALPDGALPQTVFVEAPDREDTSFLIGSQGMESTLDLSNPVRVAIAIGNEQTRVFLSKLRTILWAVFFLNVTGSVLIGAWVIRREMRPLQSMAREIAQIDPRRLHARIAVEGLPAELEFLASAFNRTLDRLEDSFERLSRFSSDIAHELRTPVANIRGAFEVALSRSRTGDEYVEAIESSLEECARISKITESLLFLARSESLQRQMVKNALNLRSEIEGILDFLEASASEKGVELRLDPQADGALTLLSDSTLFQRVLVNLVTNAIRYTDLGGHVLISYGRREEVIWISVEDNGAGIPDKDLPFIFQRFYRVDPSRNLNSGGAGLGLAIVKSIVNLHGGEIRVESLLGQGTKFTIFFPAEDHPFSGPGTHDSALGARGDFTEAGGLSRES